MARWLVVGGGLAGTLVAESLWHSGEEVVQRDHGGAAASRVAAGMFNPVSFRRVVEVWDANEHLHMAQSTFQRFEALLGEKYWHEVPVVRVFPNQSYADVWDERIASNHPVSKWIERYTPDSDVHAPHGAGRVTGSGWCDVKELLNGWKAWAQSSSERLEWEQDSWEWQEGLPAGFDGVVDARGVGAVKDLAQWGIQVNPNHGEVLTLNPGVWDKEFTLNVNKWLLPQPDGSAKLGATYAWNVVNDEIKSTSQVELLAAFNQALPGILSSTDVRKHEAGLRPASPDRRPMVGPLSRRFPWYSILNGLGTRGVLVGPKAADELVRKLLTDREPRDLTNPQRFRSFNEI